MGYIIKVLKFQGLTDRTGDANFLRYDANAGNGYQTSSTPYEETVQVTFIPDSTVGDVGGGATSGTGGPPAQPPERWLAPAPGGGLVAPLTNEYAGKYKIYDIKYNLDKPVKMQILSKDENGVGYTTDILTLNPNKNSFQTNRSNASNRLNFSFDYDNVKRSDGQSIAPPNAGWLDYVPKINFAPTTDTTGYIIFSLKYYDKYTVLSSAGGS